MTQVFNQMLATLNFFLFSCSVHVYYIASGSIFSNVELKTSLVSAGERDLVRLLRLILS